MKSVAIMQPYFFPYIGYFQLIASVNAFVIYDNIKYTKKGWINRNRFLQNGKEAMFSLPLKGGSDALDICQRELAVDFERNRLLSQLAGAYRRAPWFEQTWPLLEAVMACDDPNLFSFLHHALLRTCKHLGINTEIRVSSEFQVDRGLKGQDKVLALCAATGANRYINAIGGLDLYDKGVFQAQGFELNFIRSLPVEYPQFGNPFVPWLSIIDVMMFNAPDAIERWIANHYELV